MFDRYAKFFEKKSYKNPLIVRDKTVSLIVKIVRLLFIIGLCYLFLFPLLYMMIVAFQSKDSVLDPSVVWIPNGISFENLKGTMEILNYKDSILLTFLISVLSTFAAIISCSMVGYALARFNFFEKKFAFAMVVLTIIVPPQTILLSSYLNFRFFDFGGILDLFAPIIGFNQINLLNTPWTFVLPSAFACGLRSGFFIFIFRQFFLGMPKDLEEAARIDGCGAIKTYVRIIVPLAVPAFITVMLFSFIWHWNDLYSSSMYFTDGTRPITVMLSSLKQLLSNANLYKVTESPYKIRAYMEAGSLLTILPPLILYIFSQKYFTESIERTGIVG